MPRSGSQASVPEAIDWEQLGRATLGDASLAREVLQLFVAQADGLRAALRALPPDAAALAHKLKGSAQGIGAGQVADAAMRLEEALKPGGDPAEARDALTAALDAACAAIAGHLRQP